MNPKSNKLLAMAKPDPTKDGVTHINTHSQGKTELGRQLAHYFHSEFRHPYYGPFWCVEGFIHYVRGGAVDDAYRRMVGHQVKRHTTKAVKDQTYVERKIRNLRELILSANYAKIDQNPTLKALLIASTLPFDHYYLFGEGGHVVRPKGAQFLIPDFDRLREMFKTGGEPEPLSYPDIYLPTSASHG